MAHEARAVLGADELLLARLTLDMMRPVPIAPLQLATHTVHDRRRLKLVDISVTADGVELMRASAQFLAPSDVDHGLAVRDLPRLPGPEQCPPRDSVLYGSYAATVEYREVRDIDTPESGVLAASWTRHSLPLFPDEPLTPALAAVVTADQCFGSTVFTTKGLGYINSDFTAYFGREPRGEWIAFDAALRMIGRGTALGNVVLHDEDGAFGTVTGIGVTQEQAVGAG